MCVLDLCSSTDLKPGLERDGEHEHNSVDGSYMSN